jgi:uncharacterized membrane protein
VSGPAASEVEKPRLPQAIEAVPEAVLCTLLWKRVGEGNPSGSCIMPSMAMAVSISA